MSTNIQQSSDESGHITGRRYSNPNASDQKIIDMTNQFYLEISKNILSEREFEIMEKILIEKCPLEELSQKYEVGIDRIRQIYRNTLHKVKIISGLLQEITCLKAKRNQLRKEYVSEYKKLSEKNIQSPEVGMLNKKISNSFFPFSGRLWSILETMELETMEDLCSIPIRDYLKYRGFKTKCITEFIQFIEFENIEDQFDEFYEFKKKYFPSSK